MKRRCAFLDNLAAFNYNYGVGEYIEVGGQKKTDTRQLGSTLMQTMIREVTDFCDPAIKANWSLKPHQQVYMYNKNHHCNVDISTFHVLHFIFPFHFKCSSLSVYHS